MAIEDPPIPKPHAIVPIAVALWIALTVALTVKILVSPEQHTVFPKMAARAMAWWSGRNLYVQYEDLGRFPYSPTFAIALTPLAALGNWVGAVLWSWTSIAVYLWGVRRLVRDVLSGSWPAPREAALLALAMIGAVRGLWNAQSNALIIGLLMLGASAIARRRWWQAAALLGAPVFIKLWVVALTAMLVALAPRRLAPRVVAVLAIGAALPLLTQSPAVVADQYRGWFALLARMSSEVVLFGYRDCWTILGTAEIHFPRSLYQFIQAGAGISALAWCLWLRYRGMPPRQLLTITLSLGAAWTLVLGPAVEYNTYVVLAPFVSWAVLESFESRRGRVLATLAFFMTMVLGSGDVERLLLQFSQVALVVLPAGALLFVVWVIGVGGARETAVSYAQSCNEGDTHKMELNVSMLEGTIISPPHLQPRSPRPGGRSPRPSTSRHLPR